MSIEKAGYFDGINGRWEQARPSRKEQKQAERQAIKDQIAALQSGLADMKSQAKALRIVVYGKPVKNKKTTKVVGNSNGLGHTHDANKSPIGDRITSFIQLQNLEYEICAKKNEINTLSSQIQGRLGKIKGLPGKAVEEIAKHGIEGRDASVQISPLPSPMVLIRLGIDTGWLFFWSHNTVKQIGEEKWMKELINLAEDRLVKIDETLRAGAISDPAESKALLAEHKTLNDGLAILKESLSQDTLSFGIQQTLSNGIKCIYSFSRLLQSLSVIVPIVLKTTSHTLTVVGLAASAVTIPIGIFLAAHGITSCYKNLKTCAQNLKTSIGLKNKELVTLRKETESFANVLNMQQLDDHPKVKATIQEAHEQITAKRAAINAINRDLRNGISDKSIVARKKADRADLELQIQHHRASIKDAVAHGPTSLALVRDRVIANDIMFENSQALDKTLLPYIQQKTVIKTTLEALRVSAEGLAIVSAILTASGLITTVAGGAGIPLLTAGAVVGLLSLALEVPVSIGTKMLIKTAQGKNRVSTKEFNEELKLRLKMEVDSWEAIENSGMANATSSAIMFNILKKHYKSMPPDWGPEQWAKALIQESPEGKHWSRYNSALMKMRQHDDSRYLGEGLMAAAVKKLRKAI